VESPGLCPIALTVWDLGLSEITFLKIWTEIPSTFSPLLLLQSLQKILSLQERKLRLALSLAELTRDRWNLLCLFKGLSALSFNFCHFLYVVESTHVKAEWGERGWNHWVNENTELKLVEVCVEGHHLSAHGWLDKLSRSEDSNQ